VKCEPGLTDTPAYHALFAELRGSSALVMLEQAADLRDAAEELVRRLVDDARPAYTWAQIGAALGTSPQAAQQNNARSRRR